VLDSALTADGGSADLIIAAKARFLSCNSRWLRLTVCVVGHFGYQKIAAGRSALILNVTRYIFNAFLLLWPLVQSTIAAFANWSFF
jgi:hypothetical protein